MTDKQRQFYFRRWAAVVHANGWRMANKRLHPDAVLDRSEHHRAVFQAAQAVAVQHHRAPTADDLRHGCHVVALGRDKSSKKLSNRDFDALMTLWGNGDDIRGLLIDPEHLGSEIHRAHPELKTRERHLAFLRNDCIGGYVASESARLFGTEHWEALPTEKLLRLSNHLRARPHCLKVQPTATDPDWNV